MTATLDIEKLRELHEKATQGPWTISGYTGRVVMSGPTRIGEANVPNAALIAYVRTHLPEILERLSRT